jgi:hypothetical protein
VVVFVGIIIDAIFSEYSGFSLIFQLALICGLTFQFIQLITLDSLGVDGNSE